jgi:hypothetical protein
MPRAEAAAATSASMTRPSRERRGHYRGRGKGSLENKPVLVEIRKETYALLMRIVKHTMVDGAETINRALGLFAVYALRDEPLPKPQSSKPRRGGPPQAIGSYVKSLTEKITGKENVNEVYEQRKSAHCPGNGRYKGKDSVDRKAVAHLGRGSTDYVVSHDVLEGIEPVGLSADESVVYR